MEGKEALPPPPPIPPDVVPIKAGGPRRAPIHRPALARNGQPISLLTNHFKVDFRQTNDSYYHYSVSLFYEDGKPVDGKGIGRKVLDKVCETYKSELGGKDVAYDGEKALFTVGALPSNNLEFSIVLEDMNSNK